MMKDCLMPGPNKNIYNTILGILMFSPISWREGGNIQTKGHNIFFDRLPSIYNRGAALMKYQQYH